MELFERIRELTDKVTNVADTSSSIDCLDFALLCERELKEWYNLRQNPDFRIMKLLKNLIFYLKTSDSDIMFRKEVLVAVAKTLFRTADYDINICEFPERVRERNDEILKRCSELSGEEKLSIEETSDKQYDITIFMATYNQLELTKLCLDSIFMNTDDVSYELYLIDNGSSDGTYEYFKNDSRIKLIRLEENTGLLLALQIFFESGLDNGRFWMYMNNDVVVTPRWASNMLTCMTSDSHIASVLPITNRSAPFLCTHPPLDLYDVDDVQEFGERYNVSNQHMWQDWVIYYNFVLLIRPSVRRKLGYYEDCFYYPFYYADGDIIVSQAIAGYRNVQARDTYVHHFDGGSESIKKRNPLDAGERRFFDKFGFFPGDILRDLPIDIVAGLSAGVAKYQSVTGGVAARILFLGSSRLHPLMQLQSLCKVMNFQNVCFFAADTMDFIGLDHCGCDVAFQKMDNWYEVENVFSNQVFDAVVYLDDIMKLRNPKKFLLAILKRLSVNGKFYFYSENLGGLLALNYILMTRRKSARDAVRVRKNNTTSVNYVVALLRSVGFSVDLIEETHYSETMPFVDLETINNYRKLCLNKDSIDFERGIYTAVYRITARKPNQSNEANPLKLKIYPE